MKRSKHLTVVDKANVLASSPSLETDCPGDGTAVPRGDNRLYVCGQRRHEDDSRAEIL